MGLQLLRPPFLPPSSLKWPYSEFMDIAPSPKADNELVITVRKGKKSNTMTFICDQRADLLTATLSKSELFGAGESASKKSKVIVLWRLIAM